MSGYQISGRTAATAATIGNSAATLWNPHATQRIILEEVAIFATTAPAAGSSVAIRRVTARGTATSTNTPAIQHDLTRGVAPPSGVLLDLAYSVQPTVEVLAFLDYVFSAVIGSGFIYPCRIEIPPGAGLSLAAGAAVIIPVCTTWWRWSE